MKRKPTISAALRRRAEQIINPAAYEGDTRAAVKQSLKEGDAGALAEPVSRAEASNHNRRAYDPDTREAIAHALATNAPDLAELVQQAEAGETVLDLTLIAANCKRGARMLLNFLNSGLVPDFITNAAQGALMEAAELQHVQIWHGRDDAELNPQAVADLIATTGGGFKLPDEYEPPRAEAARLLAANDVDELALHLAAVLNHPAVPPAIARALDDGLRDTFIRLLLDQHQREQAQTATTKGNQS